MKIKLSITNDMYVQLKAHLYPGDGLEAIAFAICGRVGSESHQGFLAHELILIPHKDCIVRRPDLIKWPTDKIVPIIEKLARKGMAIMKIHSHPTDYRNFSNLDDVSDRDFFDGVFGTLNDNLPHVSAIMYPNGDLTARIITPSLDFIGVDTICVVGASIKFWHRNLSEIIIPDFSHRTAQTFGIGTTKSLKSLTISVIGCSGTGSPVIEQLVRLGVSTIILIDHKIMEKRNLNRIINTTADDVTRQRKKVDVLKDSIERMGLGTKVIVFDCNLYDNVDAIKAVASSDIVFGCMDTVDGRHLLNQISTFYLLPYFDLGVKIITEESGTIDHVCGAVHFVTPGGSSLRTRGVYSEEKLRSSFQYRTAPGIYKEQLERGYLTAVGVDNPAVISINMLIASFAVNDFLARLHPFRFDSNEDFNITRVDISGWQILKDLDLAPDKLLSKFTGRGDCKPLLNMLELGNIQKSKLDDAA